MTTTEHDFPPVRPTLRSAAGAEAERLALMAELAIMDTLPERSFDAIVECARAATGCPIALVSLLDDCRQWFKAAVGIDVSETPREQAFCAHAIAQADMMIVPDARQDPRFLANPLVTGAPHIRFYAGVPLSAGVLSSDGRPLLTGTLCVLDREPRTLDQDTLRRLADLAHLVETLLAMRLQASRAAIAERQFRQAERMANIGSWKLDVGSGRVDWSDQVYAIHGLAIGEQPSHGDALSFYPPRARALLSERLGRTIETGEPFDIETDFLTAQQESRRVHSMGELEWRDGRPHTVIGVFQDITDRYAMEQALRMTACEDDLTGLANRAGFNALFEERISSARAEGAPLAVLLLDLDNFKAVNDRCGHARGDAVLRLIADRLVAPALAEAGCFAGRLGGDEFVLLVTAPAVLDDLPGFVARLLPTLREEVPADGGAIAVSASIGVATLTADLAMRSDLLEAADKALYRAKRARRGTAMIHDRPDPIWPMEAVLA